jgi:hypothetical protein
MRKAETVQDFKSIDDFEHYCYHVCPKRKLDGCRLECKIVEKLIEQHPDWFGA